jgi:hypothetical protein
MKKKGALITVCLFLAGWAVGCGTGTAGPTVGVFIPSETESGPTKTRTAHLTWTPTSTPSEIPTVEPVVTSSPGPAPDLELFNVTFLPSKHGTAFMAEMRNNTNQAMIFPAWERALRLGVERWWEYGGSYYHNHYDANIEPGPDDKLMNCVLYPGEVGIIAFDITNLCSGDSKNCVGKKEELTTPPPQLGYRLNDYNANYRNWKEIYNIYPYTYKPELFGQYHPAQENLTYEIRGASLVIDYDMNLVVRSMEDLYQQESWVILYDAGGKIINVLYTGLIFVNTPYKKFESGRYHIYGIGSSEMQKQWEIPGIDNQWWKPYAILTAEDLSRVARIRVFDEISDSHICSFSLERD